MCVCVLIIIRSDQAAAHPYLMRHRAAAVLGTARHLAGGDGDAWVLGEGRGGAQEATGRGNSVGIGGWGSVCLAV